MSHQKAVGNTVIPMNNQNALGKHVETILLFAQQH